MSVPLYLLPDSSHHDFSQHLGGIVIVLTTVLHEGKSVHITTIPKKKTENRNQDSDKKTDEQKITKVE